MHLTKPWLSVKTYPEGEEIIINVDNISSISIEKSTIKMVDSSIIKINKDSMEQIISILQKGFPAIRRLI